MISRTFGRHWTIGDARLNAAISPCSWMYPHYGLQVAITLNDDCTVFVRDKNVPFADAQEDHVVRMTDSVQVIACPRCRAPAFDPSSVDTNRDGLCEACFMSDLNEQFAAAKRLEAATEKAMDARWMADGYRYKVVAWVHPLKGGDDYAIVRYFKRRPRASVIASHLRRIGSAVTDDYEIRKMEKA